MRKLLPCLIACCIGACGGTPSIKDQADTIRLSARVIAVVVPSPPLPDRGITYMPMNGAIVPVPTSIAPAPAFADDYRYTLAVAGHGKMEVVSPRPFSLGQCVTIYIKGAAVGKPRLSAGEAEMEDVVQIPGDCAADGGLPSHKE